MILLSHPTGNANVRAVAETLFAHGELFRFATCLALPVALKRRNFNLPTSHVWTRPLRELARHAAGRLNLRTLTTHETGWASVDAVGQDLDRFVAAKLARLPVGTVAGVYAYEDFALETFRAAKALGLRCIYDLPIAFCDMAQRLLREQAGRWPRWEPTLVGTRDSSRKLQRKRDELELADVVVCPSQFVLDSLPAPARARKKCVVAEFGSPPVLPAVTSSPPHPRGRLRVLFAGSMTQRKGLADVFAAMKKLPPDLFELVVMGSPLQPMKFYHEEFAGFTHEPPRAHADVLRLMQSCDVFLLPSIVEGRALVQQEALACGLPLLVTRNAGGEDLIVEGVTGFLIETNAPQSIAEKLHWFHENPDALPAMREAARVKAAELTWAAYGEKILHAISH